MASLDKPVGQELPLTALLHLTAVYRVLPLTVLCRVQ